MTNRKRILIFLAAFLSGGILATLAGIGPRQRMGNAPRYPAGATPPAVPESTGEPKLATTASPSPTEPNAPRRVTIYSLVMTEDATTVKENTITLDASADTPEKQARATLNAMAEIENSPLPKETKANSVQLAGGIATVDFNDAFQKNFVPGDTNEAITLNAVTAALGQFEGVEKVKILVEGRSLETLGGHQSLKEPLPIPRK